MSRSKCLSSQANLDNFSVVITTYESIKYLLHLIFIDSFKVIGIVHKMIMQEANHVQIK